MITPSHQLRPPSSNGIPVTFDQLPARCEQLLTTGIEQILNPSHSAIEHLVFILIDGFGWRSFEQLVDSSPLLKRFQRDGSILKARTQFPSTTACNITTLHTGLPVGVTGIYEWNCYEPLLDRIIRPLPFSYGDEPARDSLAAHGVRSETIFPFSTIYQRLALEGIQSFCYQHAQHLLSGYTRSMTRGATLFGYTSLDSGLTQLASRLHTLKKTRSYSQIYVDIFDSIAHRTGPDSRSSLETAKDLLLRIERVLFGRRALPHKTAVLVSADHGQITVDPSLTVYLDKRCPELLTATTKSHSGHPLLPAGSARDLFLHIVPERMEEVLDSLQTLLLGVAEAFPSQQLIDQGRFGEVSTRLTERIGNVAILPLPGQTVFWSSHPMTFRGHHGGLTPEEMEIPLLIFAT